MIYQFIKMHGLGNDFIIIDQRINTLSLSQELIQKLSHRRFGIGCDQFIVLESARSLDADIYMRIFNADGLEVQACGNATRCIGAYLQRQNNRNHFIIDTKAARLQGEIQSNGLIAVDMGIPSFEWQNIPLCEPADTLYLPIQSFDLPAPTAVNIGNPHMVFFVPDINAVDLERFGSELSHHSLFKEGANVEIVEIISRQAIRMRVWERGTGITLACATGACASVAAGVKKGILDSDVTVHLDGGVLNINYHENLIMQGPATFCFNGTFNLQNIMSL